MTVDLNDLAIKAGYESMRQYIALNYYMPRKFLTLIEIGEDFKVSDWVIRQWMKKADLPVRERGYPRTREGFYCEECLLLTSLRYIQYNATRNKFVCRSCTRIMRKAGDDCINLNKRGRIVIGKKRKRRTRMKKE